MKISEAIRTLANIRVVHRDLPIVGGCILDDTPLKRISIIDDEGRDVRHEPSAGAPTGVFLES